MTEKAPPLFSHRNQFYFSCTGCTLKKVTGNCTKFFRNLKMHHKKNLDWKLYQTNFQNRKLHQKFFVLPEFAPPEVPAPEVPVPCYFCPAATLLLISYLKQRKVTKPSQNVKKEKDSAFATNKMRSQQIRLAEYQKY